MPTGPGDVLDLIRHGRAPTRGDVLEVTGLSRMTVAQRLDALLAAGMIVEGDTDRGHRRPTPTQPDVQHRSSPACSRWPSTPRTPGSRSPTSAEPSSPKTRSTSPSTTDPPGARPHRHHPGRAPGQARQSAPTPVRRRTEPARSHRPRLRAVPANRPILPGWDAYPVAEHLQTGLPGVPVLTANDADAAALGEYAAGFAGVRSLCLVKVSTGIGTGIVINGRSYTGADGGAGDIGHVRVSPRLGALDANAAAKGAWPPWPAAGPSPRSSPSSASRPHPAATYGDLLRAGNAEAARLTQHAGRRIGEVMATVVCVLNPEVVLIGGALASAPLLAGIRETLYRLALPTGDPAHGSAARHTSAKTPPSRD